MKRWLQTLAAVDRRRWRVTALTLWAVLALPLLGFPLESLPVCTMECSLDADSCCCRALGRVAPFSVTGEASYLSSHLPSHTDGQCLALGVLGDSKVSDSPDHETETVTSVFINAETVPHPQTVVGEPDLSIPALPRPPPARS